MSNYSTHGEVVAEIVAAIEASCVVEDARAEYDIDAIADEVVLGDFEEGYRFKGSDSDDPYAAHDIFWDAVQKHEL